MNKTITVHIGGLVFNIEEEAFNSLNIYLNSIRATFAKTEGGDEIVSDIELRISELFQQRLSPQKQVIILADVEEVITIMGQPEDYISDEEEEVHSRKHTGYTYNSRKNKRVFRDPDNKVVAGVCGGISAYFGWDPVILRIVFACLFIFYGTGVVVYIILAIIIPEAKTTAEKLQMHGDPVTVENISKMVSESFNSMKDNINDFANSTDKHFKKKDIGGKLTAFFEDFFGFLFNLLRLLGRVLGQILGILFLVAGTILFMAFLSIYFGWDNFFVINDGSVQLTDITDVIYHKLFVNEMQKTLFMVGSGLVIFIPVVGLIFSGIKLISKRNVPGKAFSISLTVLWFVGFFMILNASMAFYKEFSVESQYTEKIEMIQPQNDTIIISSQASQGKDWTVRYTRKGKFPFFGVTYSGLDSTNNIQLHSTHLTVEKNNTDSLVKMQARLKAYGPTNKEALKNASNIDYSVVSTGDSLVVSPEFSIRKEDKLRGQNVFYTLYLPVGKKVFFDENTADILYDVPNVTNTYDRHMVNKTWIMTENGLVCFTCDKQNLNTN